MEPITVAYLNPSYKNFCSIDEIFPNIETLHEIIGTPCLSFPMYRIGGMPFQFIVDDSVDYTGNNAASVCSIRGEVVSSGNCIITGVKVTDGSACMRSLTQEEQGLILSRKAEYIMDSKKYYCLLID